jgi:putative endonuclease
LKSKFAPAPKTSLRALAKQSIFVAMKQPAVYFLASKRNGKLYVGLTSNLVQRVYQALRLGL